ncbi:MAG: phage tail tape measure protein [Sphaerochaeta sp.]|nr:phage tail tape measure protein [Sphaerochaeta sp.]
MANEQEIARLVVRLRADMGDLKSQFSKSKKEMQDFATTSQGSLAMLKSGWVGLTAAVAATYGAYRELKSVISTTVELGTETRKLMRSTGMTAEEASGLIAVADDLGIAFETVSGAALSIARRMGGLKDIESEVIDATGKSVDVFEKWGIQVKNSDGSLRTFTDIFSQIGSRIRSATSETEQLAIATQFFMRGAAQQLLPILTMTDEQFKEMIEDQKKYGVIISQDNVDAARKFFFAMHDMEDAITGVKLVIGNEILPTLTQYTLELATSVKNLKDFIKVHKEFLLLPWEILKTIKDNFVGISIAIGAMVAVAFGPAIVGWVTGLVSLGSVLAIATANAWALGAALIAITLVQLSGYIDQLMRDWSGLTEAEKKEAEAAKEQAKRLEEIKAAHPEKVLTFTPPSPGVAKALDEIVKKTKELNVAYLETVDPIRASRQALQDWVETVMMTAGIDPTKAPDELVRAIQTLMAQFEKTEAAKNYNDIMDQVKERLISTGIEFVKLTDPQRATRMEFEESIRKMTEHKTVTSEIRAEIDKLRGAFIRLQEAQEALAITEAKERAASQAIRDLYDQQSQILESNYQHGLVSAKTYYDQKRSLATKEANDEIKIIEDQIARTNDQVKIIELESEIRSRKAQLQRDAMVLDRQEEDDKRKLLELTLNQKIAETELAYARKDISIEDYLRQELDLKGQLLAIETERLARQVPDSEAYMTTQQTINQLLRDQVDLQLQLEERTGTFRNGLLRGYKEWADQLKSNFQIAKDVVKEAMGAIRNSLRDVFLDSMRGELKSFSDYWKSFVRKLQELWADALADMAMNWIRDFIKKVASSAGSSLLKSIFGFIGSIFGGSTSTASGGMASGGPIRGGSGTRDDVPVLAMGGEFMHPVSSVRYYGEGVMEAIRRRLIPRDVLRGFSAGLAPRPSYAFAGGGLVSGSGTNAGNYLSISVPVNVENQRLASMLRSNIEDVVRQTIKDFM